MENNIYKTVHELLNEYDSYLNFYSFLLFSSMIVSLGIVFSNPIIFVFGLMINPIIYSIFTLAFGIFLLDKNLIKNNIFLILKSISVIIGISFVIGFIFSKPENAILFKNILSDNSFESAIIYLLLSFLLGIVSTFIWIKKYISNMFSGILVSMVLVPPLSMLGVWISVHNLELSKYFLFVSIFNFASFIIGSIFVFLIFNFYKKDFKSIIN